MRGPPGPGGPTGPAQLPGGPGDAGRVGERPHGAPERRANALVVEDGWQVQDEKDSTIVKSVLYDDWHRVERAKAAFAMEVAMLRESGWTETN